MDREIQENYAKIITELFDNTFPVEPYQITDEVIEMADTMFNDIVQCNEKLIPLPILMEGFAGFIVPPEFEFLFGDKTFKQYVLDRGFIQLVADFKNANAYKLVYNLYYAWKKYTNTNRRLKICIQTAQTRWRSAIQNALMGIY